jgi:hypothetical protein
MPPTKQNHILLLKTKSSPHDGYDEFFSARNIKPTFIPVLTHVFHNQNLKQIKDLLESCGLNPGHGRRYGGLIFTSQRAVEAFADLLSKVDREYKPLHTYTIPIAAEDQCAKKALSLYRFHTRHILKRPPPLHCRPRNSTLPDIPPRYVPPARNNPRRGLRNGRGSS